MKNPNEVFSHNYYKLLFLILIISIIFNSCKKDEPEPQDLGFFPLGEIESYFGFKPGTWWIYKNSKSGSLDTMSVVFYGIDTVYAESFRRKFSYETFYLKIFSLTTNNIYHYYLGVPLNPELINWTYSFRVNREVNFYPLITKDCRVFFYPFDKELTGPMPEITKFKSLNDSIFVNGRTYKNTCIFQTESDPTYDKNLSHIPTSYTYAENSGLVRYGRIDTNEYWELQDFNIIK